MNLLQKTLFPSPGFPETLYLKVHHPKFLRAVCPIDRHDCVKLSDGECLSTDTFFGSFYTAYWRDLTSVTSFSISAEFVGSGTLRVFEDTGAGVFLIAEEVTTSDGKKPVLVAVETSGFSQETFGSNESRPSRIFLDFEASDDTTITALDFVSEDKPVADISLSLGLCTFNQEAYFKNTLGKVSGLAKRNDAIKKIYVVNQGNTFEAPEILAELNEPKVTLVEQRNLGGCGGFTRTILESQEADAPTTHHLLMDDDIVLDERLIERSILFLSYVDKPIVLGGAMLDGRAPTRMYEAGAFLKADNTIAAYCHNVDMTDAVQLGHFSTVPKTDFNAFWYCIVPVDKTRDVGLPPPIFLRGDDFEYGQRLAQHGVPTITLPGIGVWHEPFYAKPLGWQAYYDLRNRLAFGATYPGKVKQLSKLHMIHMLVTPILNHQYMTAALRMKALEDFLGGPEALFATDAADTHAEVAALAKTLAPEKLDDDIWKPHPGTPHLPAPVGTTALKKQYLWSIFSLICLPYKSDTKVLLDMGANPRNTRNSPYVLTNGPRSYHMMIKPNRKNVVTQLIAAFKLLKRYNAEVESASQDWLDNIATYRKVDFWKEILK